jgi:peptide/nickel transport system permease protein
MWKYIVRRLMLIIPTVFLSGTLVFFMLRVLPGDIVSTLTSEGGATAATKAKLREELGLNNPVAVQYAHWLCGNCLVLDNLGYEAPKYGTESEEGEPLIGGIISGNLGYSHYQDRYVTQTVRDKLEATMTLAILAMVFSLLLAFPLGIFSAITRGSWWDQGIRIFTALSLAVPSFWLGILLIIFASRTLNWSPPLNYTSFLEDPGTNLAQLFLPVIATGLTSAAVLSRLVRSMMLEVLREDYVRTARAKGLREFIVVVRHAVRNASIPVLTMAGYHFGFIISGVVVIEFVFSIPGLGLQVLQSILARDYDMVVGIVVILTIILAAWILVVDLLYSVVDPRIRYS